jgi:hypothetical protein
MQSLRAETWEQLLPPKTVLVDGGRDYTNQVFSVSLLSPGSRVPKFPSASRDPFCNSAQRGFRANDEGLPNPGVTRSAEN